MKSYSEWQESLQHGGLGHELNCAEWIQLSSGHWAGRNGRGDVFVSKDAYPMGKQPERFKFEAGRASTEEESSEYYKKYEKMNQNRRDQGYEYTPPWHENNNNSQLEIENEKLKLQVKELENKLAEAHKNLDLWERGIYYR
jgi:hypothetical protein